MLKFHDRFLHEFALDPLTPLSSRMDAKQTGSGSIGDVGSHVIDLARHLMGEIVGVSARMRTFVDRRPIPAGSVAEGQRGFGTEVGAESSEYGSVNVDDVALLTVEFKHGALGTIGTNWMVAGHHSGMSFDISGDRSAIRFDWAHCTDLLVRLANDPPEMAGFRTIPIDPAHPEAAPYGVIPGFGMSQRDAFCITVHEVLDAIANDRPEKLDFYDGLRASEVIDAAQRSSESRMWKKV